MSYLPDNNEDESRAYLVEASVYFEGAVRKMRDEQRAWKQACREFVSSSEMALKAVHVYYGTEPDRTHRVHELYESCPDETIRLLNIQPEDLRTFSSWYLSPYHIARGATRRNVEMCENIAGRILNWAAGIVDDTDH